MNPLHADTVDRLFVYGSLAPGGPNAHRLASLPGTWERATVRAVLRPRGWGAAMGFPGLILDSHAGQVHGFMFTSAGLAAAWTSLDAFEGDGYRRVLAAVALADGRTVQACVYALADQAPASIAAESSTGLCHA